MTWEVRSGFNRGLGAVGTLTVWPQKGGGGVGVGGSGGRKECVWVCSDG